LAFASAFTEATSIDRGGRSSYFAPVFGWRAHALVRARFASAPRLDLHAVAGGGGETVASSSPFMSKETDPVVYYGIGGSLALTERWRVRVDLRNGWMPGRVADATAIFEAHAGIAATFGGGGAPRPQPAPAPEPAPEPATEPEPEPPAAPPPPPDPDGDGVAGAADACPDEPEDIDQFADEDGCPDPDNDGDGIEDARDACPDEPETPNGFADADGCPDDVPDDVVRALAEAGALVFERGRARVTPSAQRALRDTLAVLARYPELRLAVIGRPDRDAGDATSDLARRRAEAVKWHLVDQGIPADRIETVVGERAATPIELRALAK
ncbi:MAG: OmpA family protein, partial [Kofleriaceae bacterium]